MSSVNPEDVDDTMVKYKGGSLDACVAESFAYAWDGELELVDIPHGRSLFHEFGYESMGLIKTGAYGVYVHQLPSDVVWLAHRWETREVGKTGFTDTETAVEILTDILALGGEIETPHPLFEEKYLATAE